MNFIYDIAIYTGTNQIFTAFMMVIAVVVAIMLFTFKKHIIGSILCCSIVFIFSASLTIPSVVHNALNDLHVLKNKAPNFHYLIKFEKSIEQYDFDNAEKIVGYLKNKASDKNLIILALLNNQLATPIHSISLLTNNEYVSEREFRESLRKIRTKSNDLNQDALLVINNLITD